MRRFTTWMVDAAAVTTTVVVGTIVVGRFLDSGPGHSLDDVPVVGQVVEGLRNAWKQVYDPNNAP